MVNLLNRFGRKSVFLQILFVFVFANIAVSILTLLVAQYFSRQATEVRALELVEQQLGAKTNRFQNELTVPLDRHLKLLVSLPTMDEYLRASEIEKPILLGSLFRQFTLITKDSKFYQTVSLVDRDGNIQLQTAGNKRQRPDTNLLEDSQTAIEDPVLSAKIGLFRDIQQTPLLLQSGNMDYFVPPRPMQTSSVVIDNQGNAVILMGTGKLDVDNGSFGGAIIIQYDLQGLLNTLNDVLIYGSDSLWILDMPEARILRHPGSHSASFDPTLYTSDLENKKSGLSVHEAGILGHQMVSFAPGQETLKIAVAVSRSAYLSDIDPLFRFFAIVIVVSAIVFIGIAVVAARYLSRPIVELADTASQIADGDIDRKVTVTAGGEIGALVDSFNRMTGELRDTIAARDEALVSLQEQARIEAKLVRERLAAEAAGKAKSDFLAHMSHELRTPLNSILGFSDVMNEKIYGDLGHEKYEEYVRNIQSSGDHLLNLINDILDLSKIEAGEVQLNEEELDLASIFSSCVSMAQGQAERVRAPVAIDLPLSFPHLHGDNRLIRQILLNLLSNALKFTPPTGEIVIGASLESNDGICLFVSDTGVGIAPSDQNRIFEPFQQALKEPSHASEGTGLGLSLSRRFVELHDGRIKLESKFGEGTMITVILPPERTIHHPVVALPSRSGT